MKNYIIYIMSALFLAACTNTEIIEQEAVLPDVLDGDSTVSVYLEPLILEGDVASRASLYFDKLVNGTIYEIDNSDCIGVFPILEDTPDLSQQKKFEQKGTYADKTVLSREYQPAQGVAALTRNTSYVACFPFLENHTFGYNNIKVSYDGQRQMSCVDMSYYFNLTAASVTTDEYAGKYSEYLASEREAMQHIMAYDYNCSEPKTTNYNGGVHFDLKRMGAVGRFYIKAPAAKVYDKMMIVNRDLLFTIEATMNVADRSLTPTKQEHSMTLLLGEDGVGLDMTDNTCKTYNIKNNLHYFVAYMMFAPIDLSPAEAPNCELYLVGHDKGDPTAMHCYKAILTKKPDLTPNKFFQWSMDNTSVVDEPIEFEEITVEQWREGTTFNNSDSGSGTQGW